MGIRQGCPISGAVPISGQLYSVAIEPLLHRLRSRLRGLSLSELADCRPVVISAYADDVNVFAQDRGDVWELEASLALY